MTTPTLREAATEALRIFDWLARRSIYNDTDMATVHANLRAALAQPVPDAPAHGWLRSGGLLYRLTDDKRPQNRDEIRVSMADGSRTDEACSRRAGELLDMIAAAHPQQPAPLMHELEAALEALVNRCNAEFGISGDPAVIAAEATLERLYRSRQAAGIVPAPTTAPTLQQWERHQAEGNPMHTHAAVVPAPTTGEGP